MSAWMVSDAHIDLLATAFVQLVDPAADAQKIGATLIGENAKSINYRYSHSPEFWQEANEQRDAYQYREWRGDINGPLLSKSVACFDYQACEHPDYEQSETKRIVAQLEANAPEFDDDAADSWSEIPWGVEEDDRPAS